MLKTKYFRKQNGVASVAEIEIFLVGGGGKTLTEPTKSLPPH